MTAVVKVRATPPQSVHVVTTPPPTLKVITGGIRGASAYESALTHGFVGTEAEWVASLAGGGTSIEGIADVPGLTVALAGKQPTGAYVLDSDGRLSDARTPTAHGHGVADVTGLTAALDGKQAAGSYVLDSDSRLSNARTPTAHTHPLAELTGVNPAAIGAATTAQGAKADTAVQPAVLTSYVQTSDSRLTDARTPTAHGHAIADTTGLQSALDGKQAAGSYATAAQGAKADTAVQPAALTSLVVTTDPRLSDDRSPTAHTHVMADLTDYVPGGGSLNVTIGAVAPTPATGVQNVWFQDLGAGNWTINLVTGD